MTNTAHHSLIILGSGPAGYTAAVYAARANLKPLLITGTEQGGQLMTTSTVDNWPGAKDGIDGQELMANFLAQAERFQTEIAYDVITEAHLTEKPMRLTGDMGEYTCDALIIATGASAKYLGLESETKYRGRGVSACATCDGFFYRGKPVAVVGGGNAALEEALYLSEIASLVHLIHRRTTFKAEPIMTDRLMEAVGAGKVILHTPFEITEVLGDAKGVTGIAVKNTQNGATDTLTVDGLFVAIGHTPNTQPFPEVEQDHGYIITERDPAARTATNLPGVFAAGDCADPIYRQAVTSAATGCKAALDAQRWLEKTER